MPEQSFSPTNEHIILHDLKNQNGTVASVTNFGARLVYWIYNQVDIVVGYDTYEAYQKSTEYYYGATIGRNANRIAEGKCKIEGREYTFPINNPPNHLHGGEQGFHNQIWSVEEQSPDSILLTYVSPDGEENYPGTLHVRLRYTLTEQDELIIQYTAETDQTTIVNITHHSFFNLNGQGTGDILDHLLQIDAGMFTPVNENLIPTGQLQNVSGTPFDFRTPRKIGSMIHDDDIQLKYGGGYDHNYVLNRSESAIAKATGDRSGITLEVFTDQPGLQFYSGNFMRGRNKIKYGFMDHYRQSFCLETQHFPDAPNHPQFPSTLLKPGEVYSTTTVYKLSG